MRKASAIRAIAWGVVAAGVAAPLVRKRIPVAPIVTQAIAFAAPIGLCVAVPRSRARDVATCGLQMWAYIAAYKSPHDNAEAQRERVHVRYPIAVDRVLGLGELPSVRLQRALAHNGPGGAEWRLLDRVLVWAHWTWFMVPHGSLVYILVRHPSRFTRAAAMTYAVFDVGASVYWLAPTAPPWFAVPGTSSAVSPPAAPSTPYASAAQPFSAASRSAGGGAGEEGVRRMMVEYGEAFWGDGWEPLYSVLGGNPLAAMPSLHFATSLMAALLLSEVGPVAGALGFSYAATLGFALVYLGEHYVVDLLAGAALTGLVRRLGPHAQPALARVAGAVAALEASAHEGI